MAQALVASNKKYAESVPPLIGKDDAQKAPTREHSATSSLVEIAKMEGNESSSDSDSDEEREVHGDHHLKKEKNMAKRAAKKLSVDTKNDIAPGSLAETETTRTGM